MRFLLDNDVDARVVGVLVKAGHNAWTANQAGLAGREAANDDEVSIYAQDKNAVVLSHDNAFALRRRKNTFGQHVHLTCEQPDGPEVIDGFLDEIVGHLEVQSPVVIDVSVNGVTPHPPSWD